ncbi:hypothetical protein C8Q70DRAFT_290923 [Cubamyces menziesii]|nr:hypothetical protein C8Q70DRAFT_290923 [Cubamyces menziesii]
MATSSQLVAFVRTLQSLLHLVLASLLQRLTTRNNKVSLIQREIVHVLGVGSVFPSHTQILVSRPASRSYQKDWQCWQLRKYFLQELSKCRSGSTTIATLHLR